MKGFAAFRQAAALAALALAACSHAPRQENWVALIDGADGMQNWERSGDANWRAEQGAIVADKGKGNSYLISRNDYADFQLRAELWAEATTNSGVMIRLSDRRKIQPDTCYEVNVWDTRPDPSYGTGAIVGFAKVSPMPKAGGKWNTLVITARGPHIQVQFNGEKTVDLRDTKFARGPIALQFGQGANEAPGGPIKWRKVQIRAL